VIPIIWLVERIALKNTDVRLAIDKIWFLLISSRSYNFVFLVRYLNLGIKRDKYVWPKFRFMPKIYIFAQHLYFWPKFRFLTKIYIFGQNLGFWPKFTFFPKIYIFAQNLNFWPNFIWNFKLCFLYNHF